MFKKQKFKQYENISQGWHSQLFKLNKKIKA